MKKLFAIIGASLMLGLGGAALADHHKTGICHNGSTYDADGYKIPISFEISISGNENSKAVSKHVENHGDCTAWIPGGPGEVCKPDAVGDLVCKDVTLCSCDGL